MSFLIHRTKKKLLNTTYEYMLDGSQVVCMKTPTNTVWFYYDATGQRVAMDIGGTVYYYMYNLMGDVLGLYDGAGNVVARYAYDAWGKILSIKDGSGNLLNPTSNPLAPGIVNPFRYRGYMYDTESGLYYLNSRYYDPETGRFVNADGYVSTGQGLLGNNMYAYCLNNPVMMVDDSGMCPKGVMGPCPGLFNCPYNTLQSKKYVPAPTKNADPFTSTGHNCYRDGCMGTVVVAEEGTGNGERLNATITVINSNGDTTFAGSTLPDNPAETYNNLNVATLNIGEYKITQIPGGYLNKPAYYVLDINSNSDSVSATRLYGTPSAYWDTATGIYIHKGSNNSPGVGKRWSVGCILIDNAQIDAFASKVGSEGILIVRR